MKEQLKRRAAKAIIARKDEIFQLAEDIARQPELGFKEVKTAAKVRSFFERHGIPYTSGLALTGVKGRLRGRSRGAAVAVLGELDAVVCGDHPLADVETGAAHACGHNAQIAAMAACAAGLAESGVMAELDGDVVPFAVPAEEYVEIEYRSRLRAQGKISYFGGKAELIRRGAFDDVDMALMAHLTVGGTSRRFVDSGGSSNGFVGKMIRFIGKEAHAAGAPHEGVNALNAALVALTAVYAQRETFRDEDHVRFHPIMTKGGDLVNVVPAEARLESYVRARTVEAMLDANRKVNRALQGGAMAIGAAVEINDFPGYLPLTQNKAMAALFAANAVALLGEGAAVQSGHSAGSTDMGDLSHMMPVIHPWISGAAGGIHSRDFKIVDPEMAYLVAAQCLAMTIIDLLADGAAKARRIREESKPLMTKREYLAFMDSIR